MLDKHDRMYMEIAELVAEQSHCKRAKVGAIIVRDANIMAFGWNGTPPGTPNDCECARGETLPTVIHAEQNALAKAARSTTSTAGATIYCTHAPCVYCAKSILQSGITRVVYRHEYHSAGLTILGSITIDRI